MSSVVAAPSSTIWGVLFGPVILKRRLLRPSERTTYALTRSAVGSALVATAPASMRSLDIDPHVTRTRGIRRRDKLCAGLRIFALFTRGESPFARKNSCFKG